MDEAELFVRHAMSFAEHHRVGRIGLLLDFGRWRVALRKALQKLWRKPDDFGDPYAYAGVPNKPRPPLPACIREAAAAPGLALACPMALRKLGCFVEMARCVMSEKENRCWPGYEPVPGKPEHSQGSCKKKAESKSSASDKKAQATRGKQLEAWQKEHPGSKKSAAQHLRKPAAKKNR